MHWAVAQRLQLLETVKSSPCCWESDQTQFTVMLRQSSVVYQLFQTSLLRIFYLHLQVPKDRANNHLEGTGPGWEFLKMVVTPSLPLKKLICSLLGAPLGL